MNVHIKPTISVQKTDFNSMIFSHHSSIYEPTWEEVKIEIIKSAFKNRNVCLIMRFPLNWDLDLTELSSPVILNEYEKTQFAILFFSTLAEDRLKTIVSSTDFQLGDIYITTISKDMPVRIENFINKLLQRDPAKPIETVEEYMECFDHNWLTWHNAQTTRLNLCLTMLVNKYSEQFEIDTGNR